MQTYANDEYFTNQVLSAPPQKLHLMMLEAALRNCRRADGLLAEETGDDAANHLEKSQQIMAHLLGGVKPEVAPDLVPPVRGTYLFVFQCLVAANLNRDRQKLADAIRVLDVECETWREVCLTTDLS